MNVGIDILETARIDSIAQNNDRLSRIFTPNEQAYFDRFTYKNTHICGNFCAKEAVSKALKTGLGKEITLLDIEILHNENGAPYVNLSNEKLKKLVGNRNIDISISHTNSISTAICIIF